MEKKKQKRSPSKLLEHVKTGIMAALLVSLIALVAAYIGGMRLNGAVGESAIGEKFDRLWSAQSGEAPEGLDGGRLVPEFIGYKQAANQKEYAAFADANALAALYEITSPCILELFGSGSVCKTLPATDGENMFGLACSGEEYVYIRYHVPVLYQLIYAYAADRLTVFEGDVAAGENGAVGAYISELVIVPDKNFAAHRFVAYAHDGEGNYYEFSPGDSVVSSDFYISKLVSDVQNINTVEYRFEHSENFSGIEPIVCEDVETYKITQSDATLSEDERNELLSLFGYNLDKLSSYSDENGYVYIDTHSQLRINAGYIAFSADDSAGMSASLRGVRIDSLLGYTNSAASGLFDKLTAVDNLIRKLGQISPMLIGSGGKLCLGEVYSEGGLLVVEYFMTYNGVCVDTEPYFRAVLTDQTVCEVAVRAWELGADENTELTPSAKYTVETILTVGGLGEDKQISRVSLRYADGMAKWNVIFD